ncbi:MFS general substrate transporter [Aspergillus sclerotiicarbonarius CBS 121057]|uniref:MFS general substrate transporter n=1 Tax=Aspergillus sclerotiicarbonarius (strain CBS 121057 / IBT 28362) TaxID=1448318 RepID=A0A319EG84_ASPSB|nr:MFS general substrate transporter [Aspergillus sclerotiicarbonarius CBS 121057]
MEEIIELQEIPASPNTKQDTEGQPISEQPTSGDDVRPEEKAPKNAPLVILCIACITFISSYLSGLVTVSVPQIATDLHLSPGMELWPVSMYALGTGCTLLISGAMSDAAGNKILFLLGCFLQSVFSMACGLAQSGTELIIFRVVSGVAASLCLPSAMSIISEHFPAGKLRNFAFALMGCGQPIGFGVGILLGGIFADTVGWRRGFHSAAIANTPAFLLSWWQLPKSKEGSVSWNHLVFGIDWIGAIAASAALAILSYALAIITGDVNKIHDASTIALFCIAGTLLIGFVLWQGRQERRSKPTLIKNSLWKKAAFTSICVNVFMIWGAFNAFEQVINFFFQDVQKISVLGTSVRFIPACVMGLLASLMTGLILHRIRADAIITFATVISSISPLLMALVSPQWAYWHGEFFAVCLNPVAADVLFTVSTILIAGMFPAETQGLAAGVFNTVAQVGRSIGLALVALISSSITDKSFPVKDQSPEALLVGYRAAFWFLFAMNVGSLGVSFVGLRKVGNVVKKKSV